MAVGDASLGGWEERAKCAIEGWEINDADLEHIAPRHRQGWAEKMCEGCPVMAQCAAKAIEVGSSGTVWGGTYIPEFVYGHTLGWQHRLKLTAETGRIPTNDEVKEHAKEHKLPPRSWVMNRPMAMVVNRSGTHTNLMEYCRAKKHRLTPENTYAPPKFPNRRECRACIKKRQAENYKKKGTV